MQKTLLQTLQIHFNAATNINFSRAGQTSWWPMKLPLVAELKLISLSSGKRALPSFPFSSAAPMRSVFDTCGNCFIITTTIPTGEPESRAACYRQRKGNSPVVRELYVSGLALSEKPAEVTAVTADTDTDTEAGTLEESLQFAIVQVEIYFDGKCDNAGPFIFFVLLQLGQIPVPSTWLLATGILASSVTLRADLA